MNAAMIQGFRQMASEMANGTEEMNARDFELTIRYRGSDCGEIAYAYDGRVWYWSKAREVWMTAR